MNDDTKSPPEDTRPIASPRAALTKSILESHPSAPTLDPPEERLYRKYRTAGGAYHDREVKGEEWTHSATIKLARHILAQRGVLPPLVRIWKRDGLIQIGMQKGSNKVVLGMGSSYQQAFENIFLAPIRAKEEMNAEIEREEKNLREDALIPNDGVQQSPGPDTNHRPSEERVAESK